jgi:hypothetical protein
VEKITSGKKYQWFFYGKNYQVKITSEKYWKIIPGKKYQKN